MSPELRKGSDSCRLLLERVRLRILVKHRVWISCGDRWCLGFSGRGRVQLAAGSVLAGSRLVRAVHLARVECLAREAGRRPEGAQVLAVLLPGATVRALVERLLQRPLR